MVVTLHSTIAAANAMDCGAIAFDAVVVFAPNGVDAPASADNCYQLVTEIAQTTIAHGDDLVWWRRRHVDSAPLRIAHVMTVPNPFHYPANGYAIAPIYCSKTCAAEHRAIYASSYAVSYSPDHHQILATQNTAEWKKRKENKENSIKFRATISSHFMSKL